MRKRTCVALSLVLLTGCTVGPDFKRPSTPATSNSYTASADPAAMPAQAPRPKPGADPDPAWWQAFGSQTLDDLVTEALAHNQNLAASNATLTRAREGIAAVAGRRLPQVDAGARIEHEKVNLASFGIESSSLGRRGNPELDLYTVGGGVTFDPDLFGRLRRELEQAGAEAEAQQHQTEAAHLTIAGRVVIQVLTIAAIRDQLAASLLVISEDERNLDLSEKQHRAGETSLVEVLSAQSQLAQDRTGLPQLYQQLAEARHMLAILIGIPPSELGATDFSLAQFSLPREIPVALPSELVHRRPDILSAESELHAAVAVVGIATANLYPNISVGASITQAASHPEDVFKGAFGGFDIFGGLTAPLFHGGTLQAEKRAAIANARAAEAIYRQTVLEAFGQVADLLLALQNDAGSIAAQDTAVGVAARSLLLSRRSFEVGNSGILQVLDSSRSYQRAKLALVEAQQRQFLNVSRLYVATAGAVANAFGDEKKG